MLIASDTVLGNTETSSDPVMAKELKGYLDHVKVLSILHEQVSYPDNTCMYSRSPQLS